MSDDLIAAHAEEPKLMPYLHLPVQSGSDRILKAMNRKHTADHYLRLIEQYGIDPREIGYFALGTESSTDNAAGAVAVGAVTPEAAAMRAFLASVASAVR